MLEMEKLGVVGEFRGSMPRKVLIKNIEEIKIKTQPNAVDDIKKLLSEIKDTCEYLRDFQNQAKKEKNNSKIIAYETSISHFEDLLISYNNYI